MVSVTSLLKKQIPAFVQQKYPVFCLFIKYYYKFLESVGFKNFEDISDIDARCRAVSVDYLTVDLEYLIGKTIVQKINTTEYVRAVVMGVSADKRLLLKYYTQNKEFVADAWFYIQHSDDVEYGSENTVGKITAIFTVPSVFLDNFKSLLDAEGVFKDYDGNITEVLRFIKDYYTSKGTENSVKYLVRALKKTDASLAYPWRDVLRSSSAKWIQKYSITIESEDGYSTDDLYEWLNEQVRNVSTPIIHFNNYEEQGADKTFTVIDFEKFNAEKNKRFFRVYLDSKPNPFFNELVYFTDYSNNVIFKGRIRYGVNGIEISQKDDGTPDGGKYWTEGQVFKLGGSDGWIETNLSYDTKGIPYFARKQGLITNERKGENPYYGITVKLSNATINTLAESVNSSVWNGNKPYAIFHNYQKSGKDSYKLYVSIFYDLENGFARLYVEPRDVKITIADNSAADSEIEVIINDEVQEQATYRETVPSDTKAVILGIVENYFNQTGVLYNANGTKLCDLTVLGWYTKDNATDYATFINTLSDEKIQELKTKYGDDTYDWVSVCPLRYGQDGYSISFTNPQKGLIGKITAIKDVGDTEAEKIRRVASFASVVQLGEFIDPLLYAKDIYASEFLDISDDMIAVLTKKDGTSTRIANEQSRTIILRSRVVIEDTDKFSRTRAGVPTFDYSVISKEYTIYPLINEWDRKIPDIDDYVAHLTLTFGLYNAEIGYWKDASNLVSNNEIRLHDNFYYQKFSYDVACNINPVEYDYILNYIHPTGRKRFTTYYLDANLDSPDFDLSINIPYRWLCFYDIAIAADIIAKIVNKPLYDILNNIDDSEMFKHLFKPKYEEVNATEILVKSVFKPLFDKLPEILDPLAKSHEKFFFDFSTAIDKIVKMLVRKLEDHEYPTDSWIKEMYKDLGVDYVYPDSLPLDYRKEIQYGYHVFPSGHIAENSYTNYETVREGEEQWVENWTSHIIKSKEYQTQPEEEVWYDGVIENFSGGLVYTYYNSSDHSQLYRPTTCENSEAHSVVLKVGSNITVSSRSYINYSGITIDPEFDGGIVPAGSTFAITSISDNFLISLSRVEYFTFNIENNPHNIPLKYIFEPADDFDDYVTDGTAISPSPTKIMAVCSFYDNDNNLVNPGDVIDISPLLTSYTIRLPNDSVQPVGIINYGSFDLQIYGLNVISANNKISTIINNGDEVTIPVRVGDKLGLSENCIIRPTGITLSDDVSPYDTVSPSDALEIHLKKADGKIISSLVRYYYLEPIDQLRKTVLSVNQGFKLDIEVPIQTSIHAMIDTHNGHNNSIYTITRAGQDYPVYTLRKNDCYTLYKFMGGEPTGKDGKLSFVLKNSAFDIVEVEEEGSDYNADRINYVQITSDKGSGAKIEITVKASGSGRITGATIVRPGKGYKKKDTLTIVPTVWEKYPELSPGEVVEGSVGSVEELLALSPAVGSIYALRAEDVFSEAYLVSGDTIHFSDTDTIAEHQIAPGAFIESAYTTGAISNTMAYNLIQLDGELTISETGIKSLNDSLASNDEYLSNIEHFTDWKQIYYCETEPIIDDGIVSDEIRITKS